MPDQIPSTMHAVLLTGHGGFENLQYRSDVAVPTAGPQEVLIRVGAAGINNTDINTRTAWYSKSVTTATNAGAEAGFETAQDNDGSWSGVPLEFPRIQGADCCGQIVAVGSGVSAKRIGERVLVRSIQISETDAAAGDYICSTFGSECDGGFAQYTKTRSSDAPSIQSSLSDIELASFPCAYSTAENMLERANVGAERVLITGASGGVGSAAVQLAKRRGASIIAIASSSKAAVVTSLGADKVIDRDSDIVAELGECSIDVVIDLVAGPGWPQLLEVLKRGGRYVTSGAIAGPIVELDVRTLYLKDLSFFGSTFQPAGIFENLLACIERGEIRPVVAKAYALKDIALAQQDFLAKKHTGKLVLVPPQ
ncbi:MAG: NADPH:quinone reductase-like Zn-dependent oxidoreductase [Gammaproteobacteria bacterium]|jgi:NADPH:quinone reductase-like Zn-dependent oxidoreductase